MSCKVRDDREGGGSGDIHMAGSCGTQQNEEGGQWKLTQRESRTGTFRVIWGCPWRWIQAKTTVHTVQLTSKWYLNAHESLYALRPISETEKAPREPDYTIRVSSLTFRLIWGCPWRWPQAKNHCRRTVPDTPDWREMAEQRDWRTKQPS